MIPSPVGNLCGAYTGKMESLTLHHAALPGSASLLRSAMASSTIPASRLVRNGLALARQRPNHRLHCFPRRQLPNPILQQTHTRQLSTTGPRPWFILADEQKPIRNTQPKDSGPKWTPPRESCLDERPVLIIGAGNLGRRIALVWASNSRPVTIYDSSPDALIEATEYITDNLGAYCAERGTHPGHVCTTSDLRVATTTGRFEGQKITSVHEACEIDSGSKGPWMAIDCLPESLELKTSVLNEIEHLLPGNAILASNSASLMTSEMAPHLHNPERLLNTHYFIPPRNRMVELMSSSKTYEEIFPFLAKQMKRVGLTPMVVPAGIQSPGFIFNRIWATTKRETLAVLSEGVAKPADIDALFRDFFHAEKGPCERMDEIGLDRIAKVQAHYDAAEERLAASGGAGAKDSRKKSLEWLRKNYLDLDKLGEKTGDGLFTNREREALKAQHGEGGHATVEETTGA
ncbi:hypothetical protein V8F20_011851 [Naviculisporaceae sp. PSN 640]